MRAVFGGCCQWVLDAARQAVEWLSQPLGFDSLALRSHSTFTLLLDTASTAFMIESGGRRSAPILRKAPDDYRGFCVSAALPIILKYYKSPSMRRALWNSPPGAPVCG